VNRTGINTRADGKPKRRWTPSDDRRLTLYWGDLSFPALAKLLDRTELTVYWRGRKLGLPCGCPDGFEYLTDAAKRTGFCTSQLRTILRASRVGLRRSVSRPPARAKGYHIVDTFDVDRAVEVWLAHEDVTSIAESQEISGDTLRRLLLAAGHKPPVHKRRWRVRIDLAEELIAKWKAARADMSIRRHADRVGLDPVTLAKRLRAAGVLGPKRPGNGGVVRLPANVVDGALGRRAA
jgi:hypothetical protein